MSERGNRGFTLVEMLVAIAVAAVLAGLLVAATAKTRSIAERADVVSRMRQVGGAILCYTTDNNGILPGPLWYGQSPYYRKTDTRSLGTRLWSYLGAPAPQAFDQQLEVLAFPPYLRTRVGEKSPSVVMNFSVRRADGSYTNPWGYDYKCPPYQPSKITMVAQPSSAFMLQDVDRTMYRSQEDWVPLLPRRPILGNQRCRVYFDGSVRLEKIP